MSAPGQSTLVTNPELVNALLTGDPAAVESELERATLLLPAAILHDGHPVTRTGRTIAGRPLLWGFTDLEALRAWDREPATTAVALEASALAAAAGGDGPVVALNPAGPGALLMGARAPAAIDASDGSQVRPDSNALVDPEVRLKVRQRANQSHERGRSAAAAGELTAACAELERALGACSELGDRLHGAAATLELARCRARLDQVALALELWEAAAQVLSAIGEADLALTALLDAAEAAATAGLDAEAERLSVDALELCAGPELADRFVSIWARLDGR